MRRAAIAPAWLHAVGLAAALCIGAAGSLPAAAATESFEGLVTHVTDGDTLWVLPERRPGTAGPRHRPVKVRLVGIDAPERCQAHGDDATRALAAVAMGRRVTVRRRAVDDYGRALASVSLDGRDVAAGLVRAGHAWSASYRGRPGPYAEDERVARAARRGLFAERGAQRPRDFRREHGPCP